MKIPPTAPASTSHTERETVFAWAESGMTETVLKASAAYLNEIVTPGESAGKTFLVTSALGCDVMPR